MSLLTSVWWLCDGTYNVGWSQAMGDGKGRWENHIGTPLERTLESDSRWVRSRWELLHVRARNLCCRSPFTSHSGQQKWRKVRLKRNKSLSSRRLYIFFHYPNRQQFAAVRQSINCYLGQDNQPQEDLRQKKGMPFLRVSSIYFPFIARPTKIFTVRLRITRLHIVKKKKR